MEEKFNRDMKTELKKNEEGIDSNMIQPWGYLSKTITDRHRLKQWLDDQKNRSLDVKSKFDRHMMNLLKKNEQHEATLKDFKEKHGKEVSALKD
nr:unnamed protein product [Callosobruchus chinensis]